MSIIPVCFFCHIKATMITGKKLFTHLYGGREKIYEHLNF
ncbi:hypothetical protein HMPREF9419_0347 [Prevotella nigrescens ATCC 33563]|nr:hypothetical protein HMPREF9419_0347 [Prevotella nigrescens ATCC 33563]